jgi:hypothetical protein
MDHRRRPAPHRVLADRLVEVAAPTPGDAEPAVRVRENPSVAARLGDRSGEHRDRRVVLRVQDQGRAEPDQRGRIVAAHLQRTLERIVCGLRLARRQPRLAKDDQRLPVLGLHRQQRLE